MIKIICDRCGIEIGPHNRPHTVKFDIYKHQEETFDECRDLSSIELCDECTKDFQRFLRGEAVK